MEDVIVVKCIHEHKIIINVNQIFVMIYNLFAITENVMIALHILRSQMVSQHWVRRDVLVQDVKVTRSH